MPPLTPDAQRSRLHGRTDGTRYCQAPHGIDLDNLFSFHTPKGDQTERYGMLRAAAKAYAKLVCELTPPSAEQTLAIRSIQQASMMAIAAIAVNESDPPPHVQV